MESVWVREIEITKYIPTWLRCENFSGFLITLKHAVVCVLKEKSEIQLNTMSNIIPGALNCFSVFWFIHMHTHIYYELHLRQSCSLHGYTGYHFRRDADWWSTILWIHSRELFTMITLVPQNGTTYRFCERPRMLFHNN